MLLLSTRSLSSKKWEWDEDVIQGRTISDGVAELLTRRLLRLPSESVASLRVLSIFGTAVPIHVLEHVRDVCGITDIIAELDLPTREGLIKVSKKTCRFVHDMIQHSVQMGIEPDERVGMLKEISQTLLRRTSEDRPDVTLFILVGLVNSLGAQGVTYGDRLRYANLNLIAGEKVRKFFVFVLTCVFVLSSTLTPTALLHPTIQAIQTPDYESACTYLESGISFLGENCWEESYHMSLHLYRSAAFVQHARGEESLMTDRVNEVLNNARSFEDKLDSMYVLIHSYQLDANHVSKASEQCFHVLGHLDEHFPEALDPSAISKELLEVKGLLEQYVPSSLSTLHQMENEQKIKAMVNLTLCCIFLKYSVLCSLHACVFTTGFPRDIGTIKLSAKVSLFRNLCSPHGKALTSVWHA